MPKMATTAERLGIVETKVENLNEKLDLVSNLYTIAWIAQAMN
jgi:hypothetical protein